MTSAKNESACFDPQGLIALSSLGCLKGPSRIFGWSGARWGCCGDAGGISTSSDTWLGAFLLLNRDLVFRRGFAAGLVVACVVDAVANRRINCFMIQVADCTSNRTKKCAHLMHYLV